MLKIAILGASYWVHNISNASIVDKAEDFLNHNGVVCQVKGCVVNSHSFKRTMDGAYPAILGQLKNWEPDIVVVCLGHNDTVSNIDGESLATIQENADKVFKELKDELDPLTKICFASLTHWDKRHYPDKASIDTIVNEAMAPGYWNLIGESGHLLEGLRAGEIAGNPVSDDIKQRTKDKIDLNQHIIDNHLAPNRYFEIDAWMLSRLGLTGSDLIHMQDLCSGMSAVQLCDGLRSIGLIEYNDQQLPVWFDPENAALAYLNPDAVNKNYGIRNPSEQEDMVYFRLGRAIRRTSWMLGYKPQYAFRRKTLSLLNDITGEYQWEVRGARPNSIVYNSLVPAGSSLSGQSWDTAFNGEVIVTNDDGDAFDSNTVYNVSQRIVSLGGSALTTGNYHYRLKIGKDVLGPVPLTLI